MVTSAGRNGNTVVAKPAEQSPIVAAKFMEVLEEIQLPPGVVNFLPGLGEDVGEALTGHPLVRFVSFTGSKRSACTSTAESRIPSPASAG